MRLTGIPRSVEASIPYEDGDARDTKEGLSVDKNTVAASMVGPGLAGRCPKRKRRSSSPAAPRRRHQSRTLVRRDFNAETIDQRWRGDLTEIPIDDGKLCLATVLDLASRVCPVSPWSSTTTPRWPALRCAWPLR